MGTQSTSIWGDCRSSADVALRRRRTKAKRRKDESDEDEEESSEEEEDEEEAEYWVRLGDDVSAKEAQARVSETPKERRARVNAERRRALRSVVSATVVLE